MDFLRTIQTVCFGDKTDYQEDIWCGTSVFGELRVKETKINGGAWAGKMKKIPDIPKNLGMKKALLSVNTS